MTDASLPRTLLHRWPLWILQLAVNAALLALAWYWLTLPEATIGQLVLSALIAMVVLIAGLWLQGVTLAAFRPSPTALPVMAVARRLPALLLWLLLTSLIVIACQRWIPATKAPWLPDVASGLVVLLLLPMASEVAGEGIAGFTRKTPWSTLARWQFWLAAAFAALFVWYLPYKLVWWVPAVQGLRMQAISMGLRFAAGYLIAITAWFVLSAVVGRLAIKPAEAPLSSLQPIGSGE